MHREPIGEVAWGCVAWTCALLWEVELLCFKVEAMDMAIEVSVWARVGVVFVGCWGSTGVP